MKAIATRAYGPPADVLRQVDVDVPSCGDDDVVVRVHATSVNPADWHLLRGEPRIARLQLGLRRPKAAVLGCDVSGTAHAVGAGVTTVRPGDEVYGSPFMRGFGAFAEFVRVPAECLAPKPASLSHEQAAALPLAATTALQGLRDHGHAGPGRSVLVLGASGGVGTCAVQLGVALGAEVAAVCSTRNVDLVRSLGASHVVDYTREDVTAGGRRYDVVLQVSGEHSPAALRRLLTPRGVLVQVSGDSGGRWVGALGRMLRARALSPFVGQTLTSFTVRPNAADLRALTELVDAGRLTPVVERTYPFTELPEALAYREGGHARGKVVIAPVP